MGGWVGGLTHTYTGRWTNRPTQPIDRLYRYPPTTQPPKASLTRVLLLGELVLQRLHRGGLPRLSALEEVLNAWHIGVCICGVCVCMGWIRSRVVCAAWGVIVMPPVRPTPPPFNDPATDRPTKRTLTLGSELVAILAMVCAAIAGFCFCC